MSKIESSFLPFGQMSREININGSDLYAAVRIIRVDQFARIMERSPNLLNILFTPDEIIHCKGNSERLAGRLAAKIAVMEAVKMGLPWQDFEIIPSDLNQPVVKLDEEAYVKLQTQEVNQIAVSISHDESLAVALAGITFGVDAIPIHLGIDIASTDRIVHTLSNHPDRFLRKKFTESEINEADGDPLKFTQMWAGKEAVAKALGTGFRYNNVSWREISILTLPDGLSTIQLSGRTAAFAQSKGINNWSLQTAPHHQTPIVFVIGW